MIDTARVTITINQVVTFNRADWDEDQDVDINDLLIWRDNFGYSTNGAGDANGDNYCDWTDFDIWVVEFKASFSLSAVQVEPPLEGDLDSDGDVDGFDFLSWQTGFGTTTDEEDLSTWKQNFGQSRRTERRAARGR